MKSHWPLLLKAAFKRTQGHVSLRSVAPDMPLEQRRDEYRGFSPQRWRDFHDVVAWPHHDALHPCVPHILAFSQHLELMLTGAFPFSLLGLVHLQNRMTQYRPIQVTDPLTVTSEFGECVKHPKGWLFSLRSRAMVGDECVWESVSDNLYRMRFESSDTQQALGPPDRVSGDPTVLHLPADLGRRYARVSGDYNLIHIHPLLARLLGFKRAIAHGMWSKARCLSAALEQENTAFHCDAAFYKPIFLPGEVHLVSLTEPGGVIQQLQSPGAQTLHLHSRFTPLS